MLIDDVSIKVTAGHGGSGTASFGDGRSHRGPDGGNGGFGGSVYLEAVADLGALRKYRAQKDFRAGDGDIGRSNFKDGHTGEDLVLPVPRGTVAHVLGGESYDLVSIGDRVKIAAGGRGGKGNFLYRSSTNVAPRQFQEGKRGEDHEVHLELKLIADIGLAGLPNVGKSSLLNVLTRASSRVANYAFTTLEPHLGVFFDLVLADIPGIIEGASTGKGLGVKFLRHIERTKLIFHCIQATSEDPVADYRTIRKELEAYSEVLGAKPERVLLTKCDEVTEEEVQEMVEKLEKVVGSKVIPVSILDEARLDVLKEELVAIQDSAKQTSAKEVQ